MLPRWMTLVAWVTLLLLLVYPSDSFLLGYVIDTSVEAADGYEIINPLDSWFLGGATSIVYNALTFNFFGIKEWIRHIYEVVASYAIFEGLGLVITAVVNIIAAIAVSVTEIITVIVANIIEGVWRAKLAILEFLFRVFTGRSFDGVAGLVRALSDIYGLDYTL
ncbi:uncharacterized protein LOC127003576 [Eriocheir sinensis]|uniref:uncharacterized protein LOC127003576 n=1 Tax=Eriocheir sinensis TaxID=95602 RepID=UPI0021C837FA|nr:uncharacterized protein LOC127003576 [Eriocheir sinensis]